MGDESDVYMTLFLPFLLLHDNNIEDKSGLVIEMEMEMEMKLKIYGMEI